MPNQSLTESKSVARLLDRLRKKTSTYFSPGQWELVQRAYEFATKSHAGANREDGAPYITHPLEVCLILADMELDHETIAAGILHDVCEDTSVTCEMVKTEFGEEVALLVAGVTKLGRVRLQSQNRFLPQFLKKRQEQQLAFERQVESLRKMLLAMTDDIRVILIKLADRLHNMKTLDAVRPDKRAKIAEETLEVYVPLANRLGMGEIRGQLQDLAFPYVYPVEYKKLRQTTEVQIHEREEYIRKFQRVLRSYLEAEGIKVLDIHGRVKHVYSLWQKLERYQGDLSKIYDLVALRIIVPTTSDCYHSLGLIHSRWNPLLGRIKDYVATPKPNGYRSLHTTVFGPDGEIAEVQIRTPQMHDQAERGIAAHWHYAETKSQAKYTAQAESEPKIAWLKELRRWQESLKDPKELKDALQLDFFSDQIFVFTPQGDVINLPAGATPVDFAYEIHSDVGHACTGAKVDGKLVPLNTQLKNGQIVDIITANKPSGPKRDWLTFIKTQKARSQIRSYLRR